MLGILPLLACLCACDGTISAMHDTRGTVPSVYPDAPSTEPRDDHSGEPTMIRAQHLVVMHRDSKNAPPTMTRTKDEARARAEEALERIQKGEDMDKIIAEYSDEPGAAQRYGDLGKFSRKMMVKKFSDVAFKLKPGEISGIVESEFGFHVIRRTE
jgi:hypothetical protein